MLVVGQTDSIGPDLPDEGHILLMDSLTNSVADPRPVLVPAHPAQGVGAAVEEKSLFRIHLKHSHAEVVLHLIHHLTAFHQPGHSPVQIGIFQTIPQMGIGNVQNDILPLSGRLVSLCIQKGNLHCPGPGHKGLHMDFSAAFLQLRGDLYALATEVVQVKMVLAHYN